MGNRQTDALHYTAFPSVPGVSAASLKAVAWGLAFAADNETGMCYPSYRDLADRGGMTRRGAMDAVWWLGAIGFVAVQARKQNGGKEPTSNLYTLKEVLDIPEAEVNYRKGVKAFRGWTARVPGNTLLFTHPLWCRDLTTLVKGLHYGSEGSSLRWCRDNTTVVKAVHQGSEGASPESLRELLKSSLNVMLKEDDSTPTTSSPPVFETYTGQETCQTKMGGDSQEKPQYPAPVLDTALGPAYPLGPACPPVPLGPPPQSCPSPPLSAKFESRCPKCKGKITPGDPITGMKGSYSHVSCPKRPAPPPDPTDRVVGGVTYKRREKASDIEEEDEVVTYYWSRVDPDGSLHIITDEEARALGLPLDEQEELLGNVGAAEDELDI